MSLDFSQLPDADETADPTAVKPRKKKAAISFDHLPDAEQPNADIARAASQLFGVPTKLRGVTDPVAAIDPTATQDRVLTRDQAAHEYMVARRHGRVPAGESLDPTEMIDRINKMAPEALPPTAAAPIDPLHVAALKSGMRGTQSLFALPGNAIDTAKISIAKDILEVGVGGLVTDGYDPAGLPIQHEVTADEFAGAAALAQEAGGSLARSQATLAERNKPYADDGFSEQLQGASKGGWGELLSEIVKNPGRTAATFGPESFAQFAPALATTMITKNPALAAGATFANSGGIEYAGGITQYLQSLGIDPTDTDAVQAALSDPKVVAEAVDFAKKRALIVGGVDAATAGIASKTIAPARLAARPLVREATNLGAHTVLGAAAGAGGEKLAQEATGQDSKLDVALEGILELAQSPTEVAPHAIGRVLAGGDISHLGTAELKDTVLAPGTPNELRLRAAMELSARGEGDPTKVADFDASPTGGIDPTLLAAGNAALAAQAPPQAAPAPAAPVAPPQPAAPAAAAPVQAPDPTDLTPREPPKAEVPADATREQLVAMIQNAPTPELRAHASGVLAAYDANAREAITSTQEQTRGEEQKQEGTVQKGPEGEGSAGHAGQAQAVEQGQAVNDQPVDVERWRRPAAPSEEQADATSQAPAEGPIPSRTSDTGNTGLVAGQEARATPATHAVDAVFSGQLGRPIVGTREVTLSDATPDGRRSVEVRDAIKRVFGMDTKVLSFADQQLSDDFNGFTRIKGAPNTAFVNIKSSDPFLTVAMHELLHDIRTSHPDIYNKLRDRLLVHGGAHFDAWKRNYHLREAAAGAPLSSDNIVIEELLADTQQKLLTDPVFIKRLADAEPDLFRDFARVALEWINKIMAKLRDNGMDGTQYWANMEAVKNAYAKALTEVARRNKASSEAAQTAATETAASDAAPAGPVASKKALSKHLTKEELERISDRTAQTIVDKITALPSKEEMAAIAIAGQAKRGWYARSAAAISAVFGPDAPRFAALLAAMSPQTSVESNLRNALNTWANWVQAGRPTDRSDIIDIMGRSVEGEGGIDSVLNAWINNSVSALSGDAAPTQLSGPKVSSFMLNLLGNVHEVTNDAWMAAYANVDARLFKGTSKTAKEPLSRKSPGYMAMSAQIRAAATYLSRHTGETWTPAEVQETIWSWSKTLTEMADAAGETRSPQELVRDRAVTDALIASTPDFSTLFADPEYASILEDAGHGEQLQALRDSAERNPAGQAGEEPGAGRKAGPFAEDAQLRHETRAAKRLDRSRNADRQAVTAPKHAPAAPAEEQADDYIPFSRKNRDKPATLNIGLEIPTGGKLRRQRVDGALKAAGADVVRSIVHTSDSEPTLVVDLARPLSPEAVHALSVELQQQAIAQRYDDGTGGLYGPEAEKWGDYNPEYFIMHSGQRASEADSSPRASLKSAQAMADAITRKKLIGTPGDTRAEAETVVNRLFELASYYRGKYPVRAWELQAKLDDSSIHWGRSGQALRSRIKTALQEFGKGTKITPDQLVDALAYDDEAPRASRKGFNAKPQQPDAITVDAYHYSNQADITELDPKMAGSAGAGAERRRFGMGVYGRHGGTAARVAFYVREPGAPVPQPEDVVRGHGGQHPYRVTLTNLYDGESDPRNLVEDNSRNPDAMEEAISDAGFDGFYMDAPGGGIDTPVAVVFDIGNKKIPVTPAASRKKIDREYMTESEAYAAYRAAYEEPEYLALQDAWRAAAATVEVERDRIMEEQFNKLNQQLKGMLDPLDAGARRAFVTGMSASAYREDAAFQAAMDAANEAEMAMRDFPGTYVAENYPPASPWIEAANQERAYYDSPSFKRWFDGSKVVDAQGKPLVAFHGSPTAGIDAFVHTKAAKRLKSNPEYTGQLGVWFAAPSHSSEYEAGSAEATADEFAQETDGSSVYPVHLSIKNPMEFYGWEELADYRDEYKTVPAMRRDLIKQGYDGVVVRSSMTDGGQVRDDWVSFYPTQVKSAIANTGEFDPENPSIMASRKQPVFRSALVDAVNEGKGAPKKADATAWKQWLDGAQRRGEIKQAERDWIGVDAWLDGRGTTTRQELADYVTANQVQLDETNLSGLKPGAIPDGWLFEHDPGADEGQTVSLLDANGEPQGYGDTEEDAAYDAGIDAGDDSFAAAKFSSYQLPGGENYRELLLTLPQQTKATPLPPGWKVEQLMEDGEAIDKIVVVDDTGGAVWFGEQPSQHGGDIEAAKAVTLEKWSRTNKHAIEQRKTSTFKSSHFDQPNILAHVRSNERTDADGKKVLFLEEIQSDWHQAGRKHGYQSGKVFYQVEHKSSGYVAEQFPTKEEADAYLKSLPPAERMALHVQPKTENAEGVPDAPFKATDEWAMLAFKRMVREAAERGFDRIAWTTGAQQAERYDLSKHIDAIDYTKNVDGTFDVGAHRGDSTVWSDGAATLSVIEDTLGKEIAKKIENDEGVNGLLSGLDLKVGGEGMRGFYDKVLPSAVNKWAKRFGGRVGETSISTNVGVSGSYRVTRTAGGAWVLRDKDGYDLDTYPSEAAAKVALAALEGTTVHSLDITPAMREAAIAGMPLFSRRTPADARQQRAQYLGQLAAQGFPQGSPTQPVPGGRFAPLKEALDTARVKLQDKMIDVRRMQERAGYASGPGQTSITLDDAMNAYRLENLMHGRVKDQLEAADREFILKLQERMKRLGVTVAQMEDYLLARAAPERNTAIAKINPAMPDSGSGISTQQATRILVGAEAGPYSGEKLSAQTIAHIKGMLPLVDGMRERAIDNMVRSGQMTPALAAALRAKYPNYVPMRGKQGEATKPAGKGKGLSIPRSMIKRALGRGQDNLPQNILGELAGDLQRSIVAAEKSRAGQAFLRFALAHPDDTLYKVEPVDLEWKFSEATGEAYLGVKSAAEDMDTTMIVMHNGNPVRIRFVDERLGDAVMNMSANDMGALVKYLGAINRWRSAVLTRFNPGFTPVNVLRDLLFGIPAIAGERGAKAAAKAINNYVPVLYALADDAQGRQGDASVPDAQKTTADWVREYNESGAKTGMIRVDDVVDLQQKMSIGATTVMQLAADGKPIRATSEALKRALAPLAETIELVNDATENALRASAYITMRKEGNSIEKSAEYAKNLTINFNRKGQWGPALGSLYLFYNAAMQGAHATQRVLRNPKVQGFVGGLAALQFMLALPMMGDDDDDGVTPWDMIPDYVKRTSLVIPLGAMTGNRADYFALPMPYGFNVFVYSGSRLAQRYALGARETDTSYALDMLKSLTEAFSPVPLTDGYGSLFGDQVGFAMQLAANEDDLGRRIAQEDPYAPFDSPKALHGRPDTARPYHVAAQLLARLGGADLENQVPPVGFLDVAPEQLEAVTDYIGGGLGSLFSKGFRWWEQTDAGNFHGAMDSIAATPIAGRLIGEGKAGRAIANRYYRERERIERNKAVMQGRIRKGQDPEQALAEAKAEHPELTGLVLDRYKQRTKGHKRGDVKRTETGAAELKASPGSPADELKIAEKAATEIGAAIRNVRDPETTNEQVVAIFDTVNLPGRTNTLEVLGLQKDYTKDAVAPNRVRQRAIKALQEAREYKQKQLLRSLSLTRRVAKAGEK